jgi:DNA-binding NarL/FixJ family response regulator
LNYAIEIREHMGRIRVLLADDNEEVLAQVRALLDEEFEIVGAVSTGRDAVAEAQRLKPDVLVTDIAMPVLNGLEAVARMRSKSNAKAIFLTVQKGQDFVVAAFAAGASAYVAKADVITDLIPAIRAALEGGRYISQSIGLS